ncbi:MAG: flavodoxin family protein [Clostridiales bacterium]|jgi:multimeric flavodoxin WrbA|nr:flavodoxin family protein [Clostridiales bacterium]
MKKNILILTGSPRKDGNTSILADAFARGAQAAGHTVQRFDAGRQRLLGCVACDACYIYEDKACAYNDDFNLLAPMLEQADVVVLMTPLYWYSFPAQLKAAIDKWNALVRGERNIYGKECALVVVGADDDISGYAGIQKSYGIIVDYLQWTDRGRLMVTGVAEKGAVRGTDWERQAEAMGASCC